MAAAPEIAAYIAEAARRRGIDPNVALEVARREALNVFDPNKPDYGGDDRSSFGVYQLHYGGRSAKMPNPGLGDEFTRRTGLRADDPSTWRQQVDFALDWAKNKGWGDWMGAKAAGITGMMGIGGQPADYTQSQVASASEGSNAGATGAGTGGSGATEADAAPTLIPLPERHYSQLADDLSASVTPNISRRGAVSSAPFATEGADYVPVPDFASANAETPPPNPFSTPVGSAADFVPALADIFKVADVGQANMIDPLTGQPKLLQSRRI